MMGLLRRDINPLIAAAISAVILIGTLAAMIESRASILRSGTEILLRTEPVDPRDFLRGDYVRLQYESISSVETALFAGTWPDKALYAPLWLTLAPGEDGVAAVEALSLEKPQPEPGKVYLKSKPVRISKRTAESAGQRIGLDFGIERYYVPEGEGLEIEKARNQRRVTVAVRVSDNGVAQIARLMVDGETLYAEPLY